MHRLTGHASHAGSFAWWQLIRPAILELAELTGREFFSYAEILQSIQSKFL